LDITKSTAKKSEHTQTQMHPECTIATVTKFCCSRTTSVEQPAISLVTFWHWLRLQTPTENISLFTDCSV